MDLEDTDIYQALLDNDLPHLKTLLQGQNVNVRGRDGRSYLHVASDHDTHIDLIKEILTSIDVSFRDENSETALDLAASCEKTEIKEMILMSVGRMVMGRDVRPLEHLLLRGWDAWPIDVDRMRGVKMDIVRFFHELPNFVFQVEKVHQSIERNKIQDLQDCLTHHQLAVACDKTGLPPLQKAAIFQRTAIVEFIVNEYPTTLTVIDHFSRTALHYAACIQDGFLYNFLTNAGADSHIQDLNGLSPQFYKENSDVLRLQDMQKRVRILQKKQRENNSFSLVNFMLSKDTNSIETSKQNRRSSLFRYNSSPAFSPMIANKTKPHRDVLSKWRTLVNIIPIHSHFKSSRKHQNNELFEDTSLYESIIMSDTAEVKHLLRKSTNTNLRSLEGWSYLHLAVAHSAHREIVRMLLDRVDTTIRDADGLTPLDLAIVSSAPSDIVTEFQKYILRILHSGEATLLKTLALNGWDAWPSFQNDEQRIRNLPTASSEFLESLPSMQADITSFHTHVMTSNMTKVRQFITRRNSMLNVVNLLESCDQTGLPPLHKAVIFGCDSVVSYILNTFVNAVDICDNMERTAIHYAASVDDDGQMYTMLMDVGAENNIPDLWGFTAAEYQEMPHLMNLESVRDNIMKLLASPSPSTAISWSTVVIDPKMETSKLYQAIQADDTDELQNLLAAGEDSNLRDNSGQSLLHIAASKGNKNILKALIPKVEGSLRDSKGQTFVDLLVSQGKQEEADELTETVLGQAMEDEDEDKMEKLLLAGWDKWPSAAQEKAKEKSVRLSDFFGKVEEVKDKVTAIHQAIRAGNLRDVKNLLDRKQLVQAADKTGLLPLQKAVVCKQPEIVKFIVSDFQHAVDLRDNMDRTALYYAVPSDGMYEELINAGASLTLRDLIGKTAEEYRQESGHSDDTRALVDFILGPSEPDQGQSSRQTEQSSPPPSAGTNRTQKSFTPPRTPEKRPIQMYIASDQYEKKNVPPPTTVDGKYVCYNLGSALTMALAEIAERRPWDPIEYLAHWLYKYRENYDYVKKQESLLKEIRAEEASQEQEEKEQQLRKEEQLRLQEEEVETRKREEEEERKRKEQEELQKKAKEAAQLQKPQLPTVTEEGEEENLAKDRDETGQTELHKLAAQHGADLVAVLNVGYSLADRDAENRTARDIAEENGVTENVESLDSYVTNLLEQENMESLQQLVLDGYDKLTDVIGQVSTDGLPDIVTDFVKSVPDFNERIKDMFKAVHSGNVRDVSQTLERKKLAMAKDKYGRSPLHISVLSEHMDVIKYLVSNFPSTVKCRDNLNRTPLHYAMAVSDEIADYLGNNGADSQAKDVKQRTPSYYKDEKEEIVALKETLDSAESSNEGDDTEKGETTD